MMLASLFCGILEQLENKTECHNSGEEIGSFADLLRRKPDLVGRPEFIVRVYCGYVGELSVRDMYNLHPLEDLFWIPGNAGDIESEWMFSAYIVKTTVEP